VPPRVREVKRLLRKLGYTIERPGKGDQQGHFEFLRERGEPIPQPRVTVTTVPAPELEDAET
jgi:hypothetical protein